ncbi:hypothetical protein BJP40_08885 [Streptomyces sp. CC53]|uniref:DUF2254 domain-containing protein n=1 Tax=unclassified Streptomyces TaxID=2593676 RepID=UPI0008DC9541|nr:MULTISPECIES: DUF2254 domain-containing protein [unclassified Streptomyces]OII60951.1 hypothetical protein BJP40_08885 [Streptomyces sp. CC53]
MADHALRRRRGRCPRLRKRLRESFLIVPLLGIAVGWVTASLAVWTDELIYELNARWGSVDLQDLWYLRVAEDFGAAAKIAMGTMSSAMLTFIGVVFSITLVALQMAAGQLSPRVLRLYVESWVAKVTLAVFLCTFLYTLRLQKEYTATDDPDLAVVPYVGSSLAMTLVVISLVLFVVYVHATIRMMRVTHVMDRVTKEALWMLRAPSGGPAPQEPPATVGAPLGVVRLAGPPGVLQVADIEALVATAAEDGVTLRLVPRIGEYLASGAPLFEVHGSGAPGPDLARRLRRAVEVGGERTMEQDVGYGLRQLVDIAVRALSPAVNDPTTAVQALDRIEVLLARLARHPLGRHAHTDAAGAVRLVESGPTWAELVDLALTEILLYGAGSPQVTRRVAALLDALGPAVGPDASRREPLDRQRARLERAVHAATPAAAARHHSLTPDRRGVG